MIGLGFPAFPVSHQPIAVDSFSRERPQTTPPEPAPHVGKRWGRPADWEGLAAAAKEPDRSGSGLTMLSPIYRTSTKVHQMSPVFRWFDVLKVRSRNNPDITIEVERTTAVLIPLGQVVEQRISGTQFSGGRVVPAYKGVKIDRYLRLTLNLPLPDGNYEFVREGAEGDYPNLPVDHG